MESQVRNTLFDAFLDNPNGWFTAAEIAEKIEGATPRKVAAAMRRDAQGFDPEWLDSDTQTRIVGPSHLATHREVRVYRLSRRGLATEVSYAL